MAIEPLINKNQPDITELLKTLQCPVHKTVLRSAQVEAKKNTLDGASGIELCLEGWDGSIELTLLRQDFEDFLAKSMQVKICRGGILIKAVRQ